MPKLTRLLFVLFLAFAPILTFTPTAQAEPLQGLGVDVYTFDPSALPERQPYTLCEGAWTSVSNVDHDWGGDIVAGCQSDFVVIHYYGYITLDYSGDVWFQSLADDGFVMSIGDETVIDDWTLKGCSGSSGVHSFEAGVSQKFDAWWYEYGGGACNILYANVGFNWGVVPESAFSRDVVEPPVVVPPVVEPPIVEPPIVEPPIVEPPVVEPPVVEPVDPEPPIEPEPPVVEPPVVVPPVVEPEIPEVPVVPPVIKPEPEPSIVDVDLTEIDPQSLSEEDVALLMADALQTFETAVEGSDEYVQALEQLMIVAQADDIVVSEELASVPVLGATIVGLTNAFNALGNFGADMSPKARHKAKQEVVAAVIVTQIATTAVGLTASAPSSIRRIK
jgi:hypothetical protein